MVVVMRMNLVLVKAIGSSHVASYLKPGDVIITFDPVYDCLRWTKVLAPNGILGYTLLERNDFEQLDAECL